VDAETPTEDGMYGDIEVTRQGEPDRGPFRVLFRPYNQSVVSTLGQTVETQAALHTVLHGLGLSDADISKVCNEVRGSVSGGVRTLVSTAKLKQNRLI
jgi:hypothetical protein